MINADKKKEMKNLSEMLLETRNLTKQYGHHKAVDSVNMHIKKGAIYGFIGRNGAGKTTCLKMISGLSKPTCGEIEMFGYKGKDLQKVRSRIGCLIEAPGLYGNMTAYENLNIKCKLSADGIHAEVRPVLQNFAHAKRHGLAMNQHIKITAEAIRQRCHGEQLVHQQLHIRAALEVNRDFQTVSV